MKSVKSVIFHLHYIFSLRYPFFPIPHKSKRPSARARGGSVFNGGGKSRTSRHHGCAWLEHLLPSVEPLMHSNYCIAAVQRIFNSRCAAEVNPLFYPVNARVVDFTLPLSALLTRKTQTQSSAALWWTTADSPERFAASFRLREICARAARGDRRVEVWAGGRGAGQARRGQAILALLASIRCQERDFWHPSSRKWSM